MKTRDQIVAEMMAGYGTLPPSPKVLAIRALVAQGLPRALHKVVARAITAPVGQVRP